MHSPHLLRSGEKLFQISKGTLAQMQTLVSIYHAHCHEIARVEYYLMEFSLLVLSQVLGFRNSRHESLYTFAQSRVSARRLGTLALSSWTASSTIFSPAPCMTQLISLNWHGGFDCWHIYIYTSVGFFFLRQLSIRLFVWNVVPKRVSVPEWAGKSILPKWLCKPRDGCP